jgi:lysozyme family protein
MANFRPALELTLKHEGGETVDTGGYTKWGISQQAYPGLDIKNMTRRQMEAIYKRDYWNKIKGDQITDQNAAAVLFDYAVNAGVGAAVKAAQTVLGVAVDGGLGPQTLAAINRAGAGFAGRLTKYRVSFYTRLATSNPAKYGKYLAGWLKRAESFFKLTPASAAGGGLVLAVGAAWAFYMLKKKGMI